MSRIIFAKLLFNHLKTNLDILVEILYNIF